MDRKVIESYNRIGILTTLGKAPHHQGRFAAPRQLLQQDIRAKGRAHGGLPRRGPQDGETVLLYQLVIFNQSILAVYEPFPLRAQVPQRRN